MLQQTVKDVRQDFIGPIAEEHLIALHAVVPGDSLLEHIAVRVRVQTQVVVQFGLHRGQGLGRWTVRVFVGVELHQLCQFRLLARHVRHQVLDERAPEFTHLSSPACRR
ncbi:hypothetical protein D3C84_832040 [compost metagenome]